MIRIMLIDDHPAVRAGLESVLNAEPDLIPVASTEGNEQLWPHFNRTRPDLVLVDYHLPGQNSLIICRRLKALVPTLRVVLLLDDTTVSDVAGVLNVDPDTAQIRIERFWHGSSRRTQQSRASEWRPAVSRPGEPATRARGSEAETHTLGLLGPPSLTSWTPLKAAAAASTNTAAPTTM